MRAAGAKRDRLIRAGGEDLLIKEKHYIDLLMPEYNISLDPSAPMRSRKHSEETLEKMRASQKAVDRTGENHPMFGLTGQASSLYGRDRPEGSGRPSLKVEVFDLTTDIKTTYDSISDAARALGEKKSGISKYLNRNTDRPFKGRYILKKSTTF